MKGRAVATRIVNLWGHVLKSDMPGCIVLDVDRTIGDAEEFGLAGQVKLLERQCLKIERGCECDIVRIPEHIARSLTKKPDEPPPGKPKRRRR